MSGFGFLCALSVRRIHHASATPLCTCYQVPALSETDAAALEGWPSAAGDGWAGEDEAECLDLLKGVKEFFRSNWMKPLVSYLATFKSLKEGCLLSPWEEGQETRCLCPDLPEVVAVAWRERWGLRVLPALPAAGTAWTNWWVKFLIKAQIILNKAVSRSGNDSPSFFLFFNSPAANPSAGEPLLHRAANWRVLWRALAQEGPGQWGLSGAWAVRVVSCEERKHFCYVLQNGAVGVTHVWSRGPGAGWTVGACFWWGITEGQGCMWCEGTGLPCVPWPPVSL